MNNIPLPIFSCIYCSNEKISFRHFIHEKLSKKYLILNSAYDIIELIKMQFYKNLGFYLMKEFENINRIINKNREKEEKIIKDSEYINRYYIYEESKKILYRKHFDYYNLELKKNYIKFKKIKKNIDKPLLKIRNNNCHFFNGNYMNNISINYQKDEIIELNLRKNKRKLNEICIVNQITISIFPKSNFNLISLSNIIEKDLQKEKEIKFINITEQVEKNSKKNYNKNSLFRKIKSEDIEWEMEYYNIWSPSIIPISIECKSKPLKKPFLKKINKSFIKAKNRNITFYQSHKGNFTSVKSSIHLLSGENEILMDNISYRKIFRAKNKTKEISRDNIKKYKKHAITNLIINKYKNNNSILVNLSETPTMKYYTNRKIKSKIHKFNIISPKNLLQISKRALNKKRNINLINDNPLKIKNFSIFKSMNISFINKSINFNNKYKNNNIYDNENKKSQKAKSIFFIKNLSNSYKNNFKKLESIKTLANKIKDLKKSCINLPNKSSRNYINNKKENKKEISRLISINDDDCFKSLSINQDVKNESKVKNAKINNIHIKSIKHYNKKNCNNENISNNHKILSNEKDFYRDKEDIGPKERNIKNAIKNLKKKKKYMRK